MNFAALLKKTIGLDAASVGTATIDRAVKQRMQSAGIELPADYWEKLQNSKEEFQELIEAVIVPETWFFRDRDAFTALVSLVTEEWRPAHPDAPIRILSAPCCTGEEPYSIVMALLDGGVPREQIRVDAIDVSARVLARARTGEYGTNSFRGEELSYRDRYFQQTPRGYALSRRVADRVAFAQGNLLSPGAGLGATAYDVIFCRNLLIYLDNPTQKQVVEYLRGLLSPDGFLFVGGAETYLASRSGFRSVNQSMSFAFRKADAAPPVSTFPTALPPRREIRAIRHPLPSRKISAPDRAKAVKSDDLQEAQGLADAGRLREAASLCENYLQQTPSAEAYYLLGVLQDAMGEPVQAADTYRKLLYLEPDHADALTHLALLNEREGDLVAARRLRERLQRVTRRRETADRQPS